MNALDGGVLEALWDCLAGAAHGDTTTRAVYALVGDLAQALKVPQLDAMYDRIAQELGRLTALDDVALDLVVSFTSRALTRASKAREHRLYGLQLLWGLMLDDSDADDATAAAALASLSSLLQRPGIATVHADEFLDMCFDNIRAGNAVPQCTRIVTDLATALTGTGSAAAGECREVLDAVEARNGVVHMVIDDLERYQARALALAAGGGESKATEPPRLGRHSHEEHVSARLDFLRFFLNRSSAELTVADVTRVWQCLWTAPGVDLDSDRELVCEFVRLAKLPKTKADAGDPQQVAFDDATAEAVFDTLLCGSAMDDAADVGKEWLTAFNGFLFFVNGLHKKVQVEKLGKYKVTVRWPSGNAATRLGRLHGLGRWC